MNKIRDEIGENHIFRAENSVHIAGVTGSSPVSPTIKSPIKSMDGHGGATVANGSFVPEMAPGGPMTIHIPPAALEAGARAIGEETYISNKETQRMQPAPPLWRWWRHGLPWRTASCRIPPSSSPSRRRLMIKPEQIPDEVWQAARLELVDGPIREDWEDRYRHAIAAALNAWPGMYTEDETMYGKVIGKTIFLPLPEQETRGE